MGRTRPRSICRRCSGERSGTRQQTWALKRRSRSGLSRGKSSSEMQESSEMILGGGLDVVAVGRVERSLLHDGAGCVERVFNAAEQTQGVPRADRAQALEWQVAAKVA